MNKLFIGILLITTFSWAAKENYLVVVEDEYLQNDSLAKWIEGREENYTMIVVALSDIQLSYIQPDDSVYTSATAKDEYRCYGYDVLENYIDSLDSAISLSNIVLIGNSDSGHIPLSANEGDFVTYGNTNDTITYNAIIYHDDAPSDLYISYYSNKEIEVPVGMISIRSQEELNNVMHKTLVYGNKQTYKDRAAIIGLNPADTYFFIDAENCRDKLTAAGKTVDYLYPMSNDDISPYFKTLYELINDNQLDFLLYDSHGEHYGWASNTMNYKVTQQTILDTLHNEEQYPIVFSAACFTGQLQGGTPSFAEVFISMKSGAAAVLAHSSMISLTENTKEVNEFSARYSDPTISTIGQMVEACRLKVTPSVDYYLLGVYGDPALCFKNDSSITAINSNMSSGSVIGNPIAIQGNSLLLSLEGVKRVSLYNIHGQQLFTTTSNLSKITLPSYLSHGVFIVNIETDNLHISKTFNLN